MSNAFLVFTILVLILILEACQTVSAEKDRELSNSSSDSIPTMIIPLPFNSYVADQAKDEKVSSIDSLPFP
jgi:hypothetical protein